MKLNESYTKALLKGREELVKSFSKTDSWQFLETDGFFIWGNFKQFSFKTAIKFRAEEEGTVSSGEDFSPLHNHHSLKFLCSCHSSERPCAHVAALLVMFYEYPQLFRKSENSPAFFQATDFVQIHESPGDTESDSETECQRISNRIKNIQKRGSLMQSGLSQMEAWLIDLLRTGIAGLEENAKNRLHDQAVRLVDAKLGSLARRIRVVAEELDSENWIEEIVKEVGELYLHLKGFQNLETLPDGLQDDLLVMAGVHPRKSEILKGESISDTWILAGEYYKSEEKNLTSRRMWFWGEHTQKPLLVLDFYPQPLESILEHERTFLKEPNFPLFYPGGIAINGDVAFYPSAFPTRGIFKSASLLEEPFVIDFGNETIEEFISGYAEALSVNPWITPYPGILRNIVPVFEKDQFSLIDTHLNKLNSLVDSEYGWKLITASAGMPINILGDWDGRLFRILSAHIPFHNDSSKHVLYA